MIRIIDIGTVSSRGQVAIPSKIRAELELIEGEKILFILDGENLIIRKAVTDKTWEELTKPFREAIKDTGLKESDVPDIIRKVREEKRKKNK